MARPVLVPGLRQEEPPVERAAGAFRGRRYRDADLAVADLAEGARVLAGDAHRVASRLGKAGVVDDPGERRDRLGHARRQALAHRLPLPGALAHELLQALLVAAFEPRRHGLDRLAAPVKHQAAQVGLAPAALIASWQRAEHLGGEGHKPATRLGELRRLHELRVLLQGWTAKRKVGELVFDIDILKEANTGHPFGPETPDE